MVLVSIYPSRLNLFICRRWNQNPRNRVDSSWSSYPGHRCKLSRSQHTARPKLYCSRRRLLRSLGAALHLQCARLHATQNLLRTCHAGLGFRTSSGPLQAVEKDKAASLQKTLRGRRLHLGCTGFSTALVKGMTRKCHVLGGAVEEYVTFGPA